MYRLRCTAKLLARLKVAPEREPIETTARLVGAQEEAQVCLSVG